MLRATASTYSEFQTVYSALNALFDTQRPVILYKDPGGANFQVAAYFTRDQVAVHVGGITKPGTFSSDYPTAIQATSVDFF
jgi:hypothetical protein